MYVSDILKTKGDSVISLPGSAPVTEAVALLAEKRIGAVLITNDAGDVAGILSERDVVRALNTHKDGITGKTVRDLMTGEVVTCAPETSVAEIMGMMTARRFRHLPVVSNGELVGIVSIGDIVKSRIEEAEAEVDALRRYIAL